MNYIDIIHAQSSITAIIHSLKISIDEVTQKRPEAKDYITGMQKHYAAMNETFLILQEYDKQMRALREISYNYHRENLELRAAIDKLKEQNKNLLNGL